MSDFVISRNSRVEARFERQQSAAMRNRAWERRLPPIRPYALDLLGGLFVIAFMISVFVVLGAAQ